MSEKVILVLVDGMRPDGLLQCGHPFANELIALSSHALDAQTVFPSVTLPCHMSLMHSVDPQRHGILTNTYVPQVRPIAGIFEKIKDAGGESAMFYGWEPLRDIATPGSLKYATYIQAYTDESVDTLLTDAAYDLLSRKKPDFAFLYMVETDEKGGHDNGWMSEEYLKRISIAIDNVKRMVEAFGEEYTIIVMADHGGHDRTHGTELPEDMTIPLFFRGPDFAPGVIGEEISLLEIAPTIAKLLGIAPDRDWEGHSIC